MSEKKSFKLNGAIVKLNGMPMNMAEQAVDFALEALKDNNTEKVCVAAVPRHRQPSLLLAFVPDHVLNLL